MTASGSPRILVIDDDESTLFIVRKLLETTGALVDVCLSGTEAVSRLAVEKYDAILCDMWMPGMTGRELYERLEQRAPEYLNRIIILTGDMASEATWDFIEGRGVPYVLKPLNSTLLRKKLEDILGTVVAPGATGARKPEPSGAERRRHKRISVKARVRVRKAAFSTGNDISDVVDASKEGVCFGTSRQYQVGMKVFVAFPYFGDTDVEQEGYVVRVSERAHGSRHVAVALGGAAATIRAVLEASANVPVAPRIDEPVATVLADMDVPAVPSVQPAASADTSTLRSQLEKAREDARRLTEEVVNLKALNEKVSAERDQLYSEVSRMQIQVREVSAANQVLREVNQELKEDIRRLEQALTMKA